MPRVTHRKHLAVGCSRGREGEQPPEAGGERRGRGTARDETGFRCDSNRWTTLCLMFGHVFRPGHAFCYHFPYTFVRLKCYSSARARARAHHDVQSSAGWLAYDSTNERTDIGDELGLRRLFTAGYTLRADRTHPEDVLSTRDCRLRLCPDTRYATFPPFLFVQFVCGIFEYGMSSPSDVTIFYKQQREMFPLVRDDLSKILLKE